MRSSDTVDVDTAAFILMIAAAAVFLLWERTAYKARFAAVPLGLCLLTVGLICQFTLVSGSTVG